jgi:hypothetical protein
MRIATKCLLTTLILFIQYCVGAQSVKKEILFDNAGPANHAEQKVQQPVDYKVQYECLKNAHVEWDVSLAIYNKDFRIITIMGYRTLFPGLESSHTTKSRYGLKKKYEDHLEKYGFKVITGTTDAPSPEELPIQSVAYNYAKKYNRLLFQKLAKQ